MGWVCQVTISVQVERRREFRHGMLAAYIDLKRAFDSVHREALWELLRFCGNPVRIIGLLSMAYILVRRRAINSEWACDGSANTKTIFCTFYNWWISIKISGSCVSRWRAWQQKSTISGRKRDTAGWLLGIFILFRSLMLKRYGSVKFVIVLSKGLGSSLEEHESSNS